MDAARAVVRRDVVAHNHRLVNVVHRALDVGAQQLAPRQRAHQTGVLHAAQLQHLVRNVHRHEVALAVLLVDAVFNVGPKADAGGGRNGPQRRRPYHDVNGVKPRSGKEFALVVCHFKVDIGRHDRVVLILNLGFGQRRLVVRAPVHRLEALIDIPLFGHLAEHFHLTGLKGRLHREIGLIPIPQNPQALELLALVVDIGHGKVGADFAKFRGRHLAAVDAQLLDGLALDGQPVGVPARNVGAGIAALVLVAHHKVLEALVERVPRVNVAVGIGRAVVQNVGGLALVARHNPFVELHLFPLFQNQGLFLGQPGPHGKFGFRQIDGGVVVHCLTLSIHDGGNLVAAAGI